MKLPVVILAGGLATRLRPISETIPKSLLAVNGQPFISHQLRLLRDKGIERVVLCVGYLGERIREFVGDGPQFGLRVEYSFDGPSLLGTAGAIRRALPLLSDAFFVLYGDSYLTCNYDQVGQAFEASGKQGLMTVFRNEGRWNASNVEYVDGRILAYDKDDRTQKMQYIDYGLSAFRRTTLLEVPENQPLDLAVLYVDLLRRNELAAFEVQQRFYEIGSHAGLLETAEFLRTQSPG